ncbi:MAG: hypothetical protein QFX32_08005 [Methanolinea sp.]|nr:hypothetical protein [Methanolinea sp.]
MFQRVFAAEFNSASIHYPPGSSHAEAPVLTPGGALLSLVYFAGALLEAHGCGGGTVHARVADPTGAISLQADSRSPDVCTLLCSLAPPCFISVVGRPVLAGTGQSARCILRVLDARVVDRYVRDAWVLRTAEDTLERIARLEESLRSGGGDPVARAVADAYGRDPERLRSLLGAVRGALLKVERPRPAGAPSASPEEIVLSIMREHGGKTGISLEEIARRAAALGLSARDVAAAVETLCREDECYQPSKGVFKLL